MMISAKKKLAATVLASSVAMIASFGVATPTQASVHYLFEASFGGIEIGSFEYTAPDFIASQLSVPLADLDSCVPPAFFTACGDQQFYPDTSIFDGLADHNDIIGFTYKDAIQIVTASHIFANGAFGADGVYGAMFVDGDTSRLTVTSGSATVPEPATLALVGLGLAGLGFSRRKQ